MTANQNYYFQWQNPVLRETIYPFRTRKLLDVLLYYYEIDLWRRMGKAPVDPKIASELTREHDRLSSQLAQAKAEKEQIAPALKALQQKHREVLSSREVRELIYKKANLQAKLSGMQGQMNITKRRVEWYAEFAPDHPYYEKYRKEYELAQIPYQQTLAEIKTTEDAYNVHVAAFDAEAKSLAARDAALASQIAQLTESLGRLPPLDKDNTVTQRAAARWLVQKKDAELSRLDHETLIKEVLEEFDRRPNAFPEWLQYMIVHFSGMRYQSAHGSWADPKELLESLKIEELTLKNRSASKEQLDEDVRQAEDALKKRKEDHLGKKGLVKDSRQIQEIDREVAGIDREIGLLNNPYTRQRAALDFQTAEALETIRKLTETGVLNTLKAMKKQFPDWMWKEIASRTPLRLEVKEANWESLTPDEAKLRWDWNNQRWRAIMDAWERKDITAWRSQHERTLSLIVSRAVCNEIAEHIQHLRGLIPAGGLTAKPVWYLNQQKANPGKAYFKRPASTADLKPGASILFLGWVTSQPNAWQVAPPLSGADVLPSSARPTTAVRREIVKGKGDTWRYGMEGNTFVRSCQPMITQVVNPKKVKTVKGPVIKEWLRWTHEATVAGVADMADGTYVLTFETGQIGVNLRPLSQILNRWDIFVGYTPPDGEDPSNLDEMLDRQKILAPQRAIAQPPAPVAAAAAALAFSIPMQAPPRPEEFLSGAEIVERWRTLTKREKQVVSLLCQGKTTREIATQLDTKPSTIDTHISNAFHKFDLRTRGGLQAVLADWDFSSVSLK
jgi:DNA-binding CsgD family transcriptional regulator